MYIYIYIRTYIPWLSSAYRPTIFLTFDYMHGYAMCVFFHGHICSAILSVFLTVGPFSLVNILRVADPKALGQPADCSDEQHLWEEPGPVVRQTGWPICGAQFMVKVWFSSQDFGWPVFRHILGMIISTDFHIFQRGRSTTNHIYIY